MFDMKYVALIFLQIQMIFNDNDCETLHTTLKWNCVNQPLNNKSATKKKKKKRETIHVSVFTIVAWVDYNYTHTQKKCNKSEQTQKQQKANSNLEEQCVFGSAGRVSCSPLILLRLLARLLASSSSWALFLSSSSLSRRSYPSSSRPNRRATW